MSKEELQSQKLEIRTVYFFLAAESITKELDSALTVRWQVVLTYNFAQRL